MAMADDSPNLIRFRRPLSTSNNEEPTIFPPTLFTTASYTRGILIPNNNPTDAAVANANENTEDVAIQIPPDYFQTPNRHPLPALNPQQAAIWNHGIAAHASSRRRPPMEIGRLLGTITLFFEDASNSKRRSLHHLANKYYANHSSQERKPAKKDSEKHKNLSLKQALAEACSEAGLEDVLDISNLSTEAQFQLQNRSQEIFEYWKQIRDLPPLPECWHKKDGGFIPQSLGNVISKNFEEEFYVPIVCLLDWLSKDAVTDLAAGRVKSLYGGLRQIETDANSILESLVDLSCPKSLYKIPLITPYAMARCVERAGKDKWKVRIGVYMNRLLPEVLTEKNLHCVMSALDEDSYIVSQPLHLPPMRDPNDPVFQSSKYPIVRMMNTGENDEADGSDDDDVPMDPAMLGSTRETKTISPFTPRGLLKLWENPGNDISMFPEIAKSLAPYLKLDLMLHQKHAICWMRQMESLPGFGINSIIWEEREFLDGNKYYYSPALGQIRLNRPPVTVGGCLCDEMGLGKTIQMLSLIASSLTDLKSEAIAGGDRCTHATLIIVPPALVAQWNSEVRKCCGDALTTETLVVNTNANNCHDLSLNSGGKGCDILITTYSALENPKTSRFLASWTWGRVVLDEQQEIRSSTTKIAKNCESLICHRRWMLSGTPIFEGIDDLRGELNFLRLTPYAAKWEDGFFDFSISKHFQQHSGHGIETLRILGLLILRRSKDMTFCQSGLPIMKQRQLTVELVPVAQSDSERALYCWFEYLVSQEIQRSGSESFAAKNNLQSRDLCLRLLREICFSAVMINGGIGAASQMRSLNSMYRKLLVRKETVSEPRKKKSGAIRMMGPLEALTYLSQFERTANVDENFVSEQQFGGGQGASSRTYAMESLEQQMEKARKLVDEEKRKETDARHKRAKSHWHLAMELITTGALSNNVEVSARVSAKFLLLWKQRTSCDSRGWRPSVAFKKGIQSNGKFAWAHPFALQLTEIPSEVTADDIASSLLTALMESPRVRSKLQRLRISLSKAQKQDKKRLKTDISNAEAALEQAITDDSRLQPPAIIAVKMSSPGDKWKACVQLSSESAQEQIIRQAQSTTGVAIKSKETVKQVQEAADEANRKLHQAEAAYNVHPCAKNKQIKSAAEKEVYSTSLGLIIRYESTVSVPTNVILSRIGRSRGMAPKSKSALVEGVSDNIALATDSLEKARSRLREGESTLNRLRSTLEKRGDRRNYSSQKSAFDTLEALRKMEFHDTFCPICQMPFGENAGDNPKEKKRLVAMISCGHFFCIKCLDRHTKEEISKYRALTCPCCRKEFNPSNDVTHIDHSATDLEEAAIKRDEAKNKVLEASEFLETSDGVLEGELWRYLFLSFDIPTWVSDAPNRVHTALPPDVLAHFRAATGMHIDCSRSEVPMQWKGIDARGKYDKPGLSSKVQALLRDLPLGEHAVVFSTSKEGVLHLSKVISANGIECFSLYTGATASTESWAAVKRNKSKAGPVLVIQAGAAASGLTLTVASKIFLMEPFNRQEEEQQAYARCHRYGQTRDVHVKVYYAPVSVESRLLRWRKCSAANKITTNNGPNYVYSNLHEIDTDNNDDETDEEIKCEVGSTQDTLSDMDEQHGDNLRTQFLLGLVDENGNSVGNNARDTQQDDLLMN